MLARSRFSPVRRHAGPAAIAVALIAAGLFAPLQFTPLAVAAGDEAVATAPIPQAQTAPAEEATTATAAPQPEAPPPVNPELKAKLDGSRPVVIEGERAHSDLLRKFYAARNYDTVWDKQPVQVEALLAAIGRAEEHGLNPNLFHATLLQRRGAALTPLDRELLISDAVLGFADALGRGAVPPEERPSTWALTPGAVDTVAAVDKALAEPDPARAIEALAPQTPEYTALQRAYAQARTPAPVPAGRGQRVPMQQPGPSAQLKELAVALERERWLPRHLPATRLWVNTEDAHLDFYRDNQKVFSTRVIVGQVDKQTPEFETHSPSVLFNPPWYVPRSIFVKEIMPKLAYNPGYLAEHHMSWHAGTVRQDAGPYSALGRLKFEMQDPFDVYLHDTPSRGLFAAADRRRSHGCVRVENPVKLASVLLNEDESSINRKVGVGYSHRQELAHPVPVFVVYQTVTVDAGGKVQFHPDGYGRDDRVWQALNRAPQAETEQIASVSRPRG
ncbi:MAG TPA: L,D-transpeptidase family protein [Stellaceae bacterium]|nr:L,D-transpeptidase family protein [Stellaceae bacterium]